MFNNKIIFSIIIIIITFSVITPIEADTLYSLDGYAHDLQELPKEMEYTENNILYSTRDDKFNIINYDNSIPVSFQQKTTPIRYQFAGDCYAFATIAGIETSIVKQLGKYVDLSEEQFINTFAKNTGTNGEGGEWHEYTKLANNTIFINESYNPYDKNSNTNKVVTVSDGVEVEVINVLGTKENIKKAILKYGAVSGGIDASEYERCIHDGEHDYYLGSNNTQTHAICIIGWNDDLSVHDYRTNTDYKGFWIVKNSWGGIDYVSYEHNTLYSIGLSCYNIIKI